MTNTSDKILMEIKDLNQYIKENNLLKNQIETDIFITNNKIKSVLKYIALLLLSIIFILIIVCCLIYIKK